MLSSSPIWSAPGGTSLGCRREVLALQMVQGPRVAGLLGGSAPDDTSDATPWFATEYVRGLTLKEYVEHKGPLPLPAVAALGVLLAEALAAIHDAHLLHRDLKP